MADHELIERIQALYERATQGPWTLTHCSGNNFAVQEFEIRGKFGDKENVYPIFHKSTAAIDGTTVYVSPDDAQLIAALHNAWPALYAALRGLKDERAAVIEECARVCDTRPAEIQSAAGNQGMSAYAEGAHNEAVVIAVRLRALAAAPKVRTAHTDHPLRHFDRTCPACIAQGEE